MKDELLEIASQLAALTEKVNNLIAQLEQSEQVVTAEEVLCNESDVVEEMPIQIDSTLSKSEPEAETVKSIQFTLNDRYRFLREIFGNSTAEMSSAIADLEAMDSATEVNAYVTRQLGLDPEQDVVKEFLAVVNERFNEYPTLLA
jgi:hypothetical protein